MPLNSGFQWITMENVTATTATGRIVGGTDFNDVSVSITHSVGGMGPHDGTVGANVFPVEYNVPLAGTSQLQSTQAGIFRAVFNKPVVNPLIAFASVGGVVSVPVEISRPFTPIWTDSTQGSTVYENPANATQYNQFTGTEGFNIIRIDGTFTEVTFSYTVSEFYSTIGFGFVDQNDPANRSLFRDPFYNRFASGNEDGHSRFRRLWLLGHV